MNERIKELRSSLKLSQEIFASRIKITRSSVSKLEKGENNPSEQTIALICKQFNVNEEWLKNGTGDMFKEIPEEDETAILLSDLLEDNGETPLYETIKGIIRTYQQLDPKSQSILNEIINKCHENIQKKEEN